MGTGGSGTTVLCAAWSVSLRNNLPLCFLSGFEPKHTVMIEVAEDDTLGRYYIAASDLPAGMSVLSASPHALALSDSFLESHCSSCCKPTLAAPCPDCEKLRFCDACQTSETVAVSLHAAECQGIKHLFTAGKFTVEESRTVRLLMRLLVLRALDSGALDEEELGVDADLRPSFTDVEQLCNNLDAMPESLLQSFANIVKQTRSLVGSECRISIQEGVELLARVYCNAHELINPDGADVDMGFGLFMEGCLFNHSCNPNCTWCLDGDANLVVRSIARISTGDALTLAYCDPYERLSERGPQLQRCFFFECKCERCSDPDRSDERKLRAGSAKVDSAVEDKVQEAYTRARGLASRGEDALATKKLLGVEGETKMLAETHALRIKIARLQMTLLERAQRWELLAAQCRTLASALVDVFGPDRVLTDLKYGHTLWKATKAKSMLATDAASREEATAQGRKALRVFATTLGSAHWYVRQLNDEIKQMSDPTAATKASNMA